jgi:hypothetical protein
MQYAKQRKVKRFIFRAVAAELENWFGNNLKKNKTATV